MLSNVTPRFFISFVSFNALLFKLILQFKLGLNWRNLFLPSFTVSLLLSIHNEIRCNSSDIDLFSSLTVPNNTVSSAKMVIVVLIGTHFRKIFHRTKIGL